MAADPTDHIPEFRVTEPSGTDDWRIQDLSLSLMPPNAAIKMWTVRAREDEPERIRVWARLIVSEHGSGDMSLAFFGNGELILMPTRVVGAVFTGSPPPGADTFPAGKHLVFSLPYRQVEQVWLDHEKARFSKKPLQVRLMMLGSPDLFSLVIAPAGSRNLADDTVTALQADALFNALVDLSSQDRLAQSGLPANARRLVEATAAGRTEWSGLTQIARLSETDIKVREA